MTGERLNIMKLWQMTLKVDNKAWGSTTYRAKVLILSKTEEEAKEKAKKWWLNNKKWAKKDNGSSLFSFGGIDGDISFVGVEEVCSNGLKDVFLL